jgi:DNA-binding IclR family transcriptional regulator
MNSDLTDKNKQIMIQSLYTGFGIIDLVVKSNRPLKFNDIHELTKITKSNLYKYLNTLTHLRVLHRDKSTGMYTAGSQLINYGMTAVNQENIVERVTPHLQDINRYSGETVLLSVWTHDGPMVISMLSSQHTLNIGAQIGSYLPLYSASGKIFGAFMDPYKLHDWKEQQPEDISYPNREQYREQLMLDLETVRKDKISFANEPLIGSISSMSIPILNFQQKLLCSITIVGFTDDIPKSKDDRLSQYLIQKGTEISTEFGG